jgi:hypothetical protein
MGGPQFFERNQSQATVLICPRLFTSSVKGNDDFPSWGLRQQRTSVERGYKISDVVALAANKTGYLHGYTYVEN